MERKKCGAREVEIDGVCLKCADVDLPTLVKIGKSMGLDVVKLLEHLPRDANTRKDVLCKELAREIVKRTVNRRRKEDNGEVKEIINANVSDIESFIENGGTFSEKEYDLFVRRVRQCKTLSKDHLKNIIAIVQILEYYDYNELFKNAVMTSGFDMCYSNALAPEDELQSKLQRQLNNIVLENSSQMSRLRTELDIDFRNLGELLRLRPIRKHLRNEALRLGKRYLISQLVPMVISLKKQGVPRNLATAVALRSMQLSICEEIIEGDKKRPSAIFDWKILSLAKLLGLPLIELYTLNELKQYCEKTSNEIQRLMDPRNREKSRTLFEISSEIAEEQERQEVKRLRRLRLEQLLKQMKE